jgi:hypothetical protein
MEAYKITQGYHLMMHIDDPCMLYRRSCLKEIETMIADEMKVGIVGVCAWFMLYMKLVLKMETPSYVLD